MLRLRQDVHIPYFAQPQPCIAHPAGKQATMQPFVLLPTYGNLFTTHRLLNESLILTFSDQPDLVVSIVQFILLCLSMAENHSIAPPIDSPPTI